MKPTQVIYTPEQEQCAKEVIDKVLAEDALKNERREMKKDDNRPHGQSKPGGVGATPGIRERSLCDAHSSGHYLPLWGADLD